MAARLEDEDVDDEDAEAEDDAKEEEDEEFFRQLLLFEFGFIEKSSFIKCLLLLLLLFSVLAYGR